MLWINDLHPPHYSPVQKDLNTQKHDHDAVVNVVKDNIHPAPRQELEHRLMCRYNYHSSLGHTLGIVQSCGIGECIPVQLHALHSERHLGDLTQRETDEEHQPEQAVVPLVVFYCGRYIGIGGVYLQIDKVQHAHRSKEEGTDEKGLERDAQNVVEEG